LNAGGEDLRFKPARVCPTLRGMGTKYLPTNQDRKNGQRFLSQQRPLPFFQKPADKQPTDQPGAKTPRQARKK
jgi:hypothetical protein